MSFHCVLRRNAVLLAVIFSLVNWSHSHAQSSFPTYTRVTYQKGELTLEGHLCRPSGSGPFPAVMYNHGGMGHRIGGDPRGTCMALARDGYIGFAPMRRPTVSLHGHLADVLSGLAYVEGLENVDTSRIGMMGFSRGALLTLLAGTRRSHLKALVIMAPAPGRGTLDRALKDVDNMTAPVLLLVARNDKRRADHVRLSRTVKRALDAANKQSELIVYPPYRRDGHRLFFTVGDYWRDIQNFLSSHLQP